MLDMTNTEARTGFNMGKDMANYLDAFDAEEFRTHMEKTRQAKALADKAAKSKWRHRAFRLLGSPWFENAMGLVIVLNMFVMIIEIDRSVAADDAEGVRIHWTDICGWIALLIFIFDMAVRLVALRRTFWKDTGNIFDFVVVAADVGCTVIDIIAGSRFPVSALRIFRLAKLARVSKVVRVFPELRLLIAGLMSSMSAIFWGTVLLAFWLLVWAMVAVLFIQPINAHMDYRELGCERCPRAYSSVANASLTLWQQLVTGDSWGQATIPLIEQNPSTLLVFIPAFLSIGMAVMNLILGVVVSAAQTAKDKLEKEEYADDALNKLEKQSHLFKLCKDMDKDNDGELSYQEILGAFQSDGEVRDIMLSLDITMEEFNVAWTIMDANDSDSVSYKEFISSLCRMKNSDIQFMLAYIKFYVVSMKHNLVEHLRPQLQQSAQENLAEKSPSGASQWSPTAELHGGATAILETGRGGDGLGTVSKPRAHVDTKSQETDQKGLRIASTSGIAAERLSHITSQMWHDEVQDWVNKVCSEIDTLRTELVGKLADTENKLRAEEHSAFRIQQGQHDLLVASSKHKKAHGDKSSMVQSLQMMGPSGDIATSPSRGLSSAVKFVNL